MSCFVTDILAAYPPGLFQSQAFFSGSAHAFAPSRLERTAGKSERLINGASTSYERLRKVPPLLEDFLSRWKESLRGGSWANPLSKPHPQNLLAGKVPLGGYAAIVPQDRGGSLQGHPQLCGGMGVRGSCRVSIHSSAGTPSPILHPDNLELV